jgi:hypothetical protein
VVFAATWNGMNEFECEIFWFNRHIHFFLTKPNTKGQRVACKKLHSQSELVGTPQQRKAFEEFVAEARVMCKLSIAAENEFWLTIIFFF